MQRNTVAYDEGHNFELERKLFLADAISDLPPVKSFSFLFLLFYDSMPLCAYIYLVLFRLRIVKIGMKCHMENPQKQIFKSLSESAKIVRCG